MCAHSQILLVTFLLAGVSLIQGQLSTAALGLNCYKNGPGARCGDTDQTSCMGRLQSKSYTDLGTQCNTPQNRALCCQTCAALLAAKAPRVAIGQTVQTGLCFTPSDAHIAFFNTIRNCNSTPNTLCSGLNTAGWCTTVMSCTNYFDLMSRGCESICNGVTSNGWCSTTLAISP